MKRVTVKHRTAMVVDALNITHENDLAEPIALYIKNDEQFPHVVLLLPSGQGLDAVGSYHGSRVRGLRVVPLTPSQIQQPDTAGAADENGGPEQVARTGRGPDRMNEDMLVWAIS